jgi:hypothetical protein
MQARPSARSIHLYPNQGMGWHLAILTIVFGLQPALAPTLVLHRRYSKAQPESTGSCLPGLESCTTATQARPRADHNLINYPAAAAGSYRLALPLTHVPDGHHKEPEEAHNLKEKG